MERSGVDDKKGTGTTRFGVFGTTVVAFFLADPAVAVQTVLNFDLYSPHAPI